MQNLCESGKYVQSLDRKARTLSRSGTSCTVEKCIHHDTGKQLAVKRISQANFLKYQGMIHNEQDAAGALRVCNIPRVVQWLDTVVSPKFEYCMILELVEGSPLRKWRKLFTPPLVPAENEIRTKEVAVQLLETLEMLHTKAGWAHLDITSNNIMLSKKFSSKWDQLRLIDFGLSQCRRGDGTGQRYCKVKPPGCTLRYASPEQIRSLQMRHEWEYRVAKPYPEQAATTSGGHGLKSAVRKVKQAWKERKLAIAEERLLDAFCNRLEGCPISGGCHTYVDGASADSYAAGVVLYEMMTGQLPFFPNLDEPRPVAPEWMAEEGKERWQEYEMMLTLHRQWERAVASDGTGKYNIQHPMLDKVRECSAQPEEAAAFFGGMLWPVPEHRLSACGLQSDYLKEVYLQMQTDQAQPQNATGAAEQQKARNNPAGYHTSSGDKQQLHEGDMGSCPPSETASDPLPHTAYAASSIAQNLYRTEPLPLLPLRWSQPDTHSAQSPRATQSEASTKALPDGTQLGPVVAARKGAFDHISPADQRPVSNLVQFATAARSNQATLSAPSSACPSPQSDAVQHIVSPEVQLAAYAGPTAVAALQQSASNTIEPPGCISPLNNSTPAPPASKQRCCDSVQAEVGKGPHRQAAVPKRSATQKLKSWLKKPVQCCLPSKHSSATDDTVTAMTASTAPQTKQHRPAAQLQLADMPPHALAATKASADALLPGGAAEADSWSIAAPAAQSAVDIPSSQPPTREIVASYRGDLAAYVTKVVPVSEAVPGLYGVTKAVPVTEAVPGTEAVPDVDTMQPALQQLGGAAPCHDTVPSQGFASLPDSTAEEARSSSSSSRKAGARRQPRCFMQKAFKKASVLLKKAIKPPACCCA